MDRKKIDQWFDSFLPYWQQQQKYGIEVKCYSFYNWGSPLNSLSGSLPVDGTMAKNVLSKFLEKFNQQVGTLTLIINLH